MVGGIKNFPKGFLPFIGYWYKPDGLWLTSMLDITQIMEIVYR